MKAFSHSAIAFSPSNAKQLIDYDLIFQIFVNLSQLFLFLNGTERVDHEDQGLIFRTSFFHLEHCKDQ